MCGIVTYVGPRNCVPVLMEGLRRVEYRGYDSAGIACFSPSEIVVYKTPGKVRELAAVLPGDFHGNIGIAHTRWATHGVPNQVNAHPHVDNSGRFAVIHNGIFENAFELRRKMEAQGIVFKSETDTEVFAQLLGLEDDQDIVSAVRRALSSLEGTYGVAVLDLADRNRVVVARKGSPLVLGIGDGEMFAASDVAALVPYTQRVVYLDDGELAVLSREGYEISTLDGVRVDKEEFETQVTSVSFEKGDHEHFMHKEIFEQGDSLRRVISGRLDFLQSMAHLGGVNLSDDEIRAIRRVKVLGCGSAYYAGMLGALLMEGMARVPSSAESAAEFRYRNPVIDKDTLYVIVSQSGETYDTRAALKELHRKGAKAIGIINVVGSTIARECDGGIYIHAGPEVSVASTKAFTNSVVALTLLAVHIGRLREMSEADGDRILRGLSLLPLQVEEVLKLEEEIGHIAEKYASAKSMFFIGRVMGYPIALEGAQKLKEISYVHAEAYPASELKHGPLAVVSPEVPTVAILPDDDLWAKNISAVQEIRARGGRILGIGHTSSEDSDDFITVPKSEPELDPILLTIPLQILAYRFALALGRDVDQPRNLAKAVTVE